MKFVADLHIHSRFSLATSKQLNIPHLARWAVRKGINVLASGDFTHPKWREELRQNLVLDEESGFYRTREKLPGGAPLFCLQAEISSIYKKYGKTRKIHNLVFAPDFETADKISARLALVGNLNSDGRPILGLDSRDLLEIVLECSEDAVLVPAHIWTPWFSLFGSRSGFDRIEDCYGDLTPHIFALETGLSSDPPMNRCLSALDGYTMISSSDAHSGPNLGREANLFYGKPSYTGMFAALKKAARREDASKQACRFLGTLEFYPEEGKYHLDGHRSCNVVLQPAQSRELANICPVCGKPLTIGVLHRVMELADRDKPGVPPFEPETRMLVPLPEVVAQILGTGINSHKVEEKCLQAVETLGPELDILCQIPLEAISRYWEPLGSAIARIRAGNVTVVPGYDGQYGRILVTDPEKGATLPLPGTVAKSSPILKSSSMCERTLLPFPKTGIDSEVRQKVDLQLSADQCAARDTEAVPLFVCAGPGTGKTRVLVARLLKLAKMQSGKILAVTFTRRAASEIRQRLEEALPKNCQQPDCDTLHGLAYGLLLASAKNSSGSACEYVLVDEDVARKFFMDANGHLPKRQARQLWDDFSLLREKRLLPEGELLAAATRYQEYKKRFANAPVLDYADLLEWLLANADEFRGHWAHILVDEAQDLSPLQIEIVRALLPPDGSGFFGIGDPEQSIYSFRGACANCITHFQDFWPDLRQVRLGKNYRSLQQILDMATAVLASPEQKQPLQALKNGNPTLRIFHARDDHDEASWIAEKICDLLGSTSHTLMDGQDVENRPVPGDIAVLVRLQAQIQPIVTELKARGIPCTAPAKMRFWQNEQCEAFLNLAMHSGTTLKPHEFAGEIIAAQAVDNPALAASLTIFRDSADFEQLCALWNQSGTWAALFEHLAWLQEAEMIGEKARNVCVLTLHASKGLEFDTVFLPGLEDGLMPLNRGLLSSKPAISTNIATDRSNNDYSEEQRLLYVGITRAANSVYISHCATRRLYGSLLALKPSPFLNVLDNFCSHSRRIKKLRRKAQSLSLFSISNKNQTV